MKKDRKLTNKEAQEVFNGYCENTKKEEEKEREIRSIRYLARLEGENYILKKILEQKLDIKLNEECSYFE